MIANYIFPDSWFYHIPAITRYWFNIFQRKMEDGKCFIPEYFISSFLKLFNCSKLSGNFSSLKHRETIRVWREVRPFDPKFSRISFLRCLMEGWTSNSLIQPQRIKVSKFGTTAKSSNLVKDSEYDRSMTFKLYKGCQYQTQKRRIKFYHNK